MLQKRDHREEVAANRAIEGVFGSFDLHKNSL